MSIYDVEILDNNQVVTSHDDGTLRVWDSETGNGHKNSSNPRCPFFFQFNSSSLQNCNLFNL